ncbi:MAG: hypothetical protein Tsb0020_14810 [Haliangiales bacterium]
MVAVSAKAEDVPEMKQKTNVTFPLYYDPDLSAIKAWQAYDGDNGIAKPATFVVAADGTIAYQYIGKEKSDRPVLDEVMAVLEQLRDK